MKLKYILILVVAAFTACSKGGGSTQEPDPKPDPATDVPAKAVLSAPANNALCLEGTPVSETVSKVTFTWAKEENAAGYEIHVENLATQESTMQTLSATSVQLDIARSTPYSWYIVAVASDHKTKTASDTWRFYNAGVATAYYAPFPASDLKPSMDTTLTATNGLITLSWSGTDVDGDLDHYDIFMGTEPSSLKTFRTGLSVSHLEEVAVTSSTRYYWKVISYDKKGNSSETGVSTFFVK